jgi:voltage-gated potassium channel
MATRTALSGKRRSKVRSHRYLGPIAYYGKLICLVALAIALMSVAFYISESGAGQSADQTLWQIAVYFFTGFGDYEPRTVAGKLIAVTVFLLGIALVATATGRVASFFVRRDLEIKMPEHMSDHIVICNWNDRGDRIVSELHTEQGVADTEIIVIAPKEVNPAEHKGNEAYELVTFINSDPSFHDVLRVCNVHRARSVILIADEVGHPEDPDGNSALIALAINRLCDDAGIQRPHIVAEALDHRRIKHLKDAGVDEVICAHDFGLGILAQCSINHGLSAVYNRLLTYSDTTNEIYIIDEVPERFFGLTFAEAAIIFARNRGNENPAILIGVKRGHDMHLNARENGDNCGLGKIREGDSLIVIAFDPPDLSRYHNDH